MEPRQILAQAIGFLALAEGLFIYLSTRRDRILRLKLVSDGLWFLNYLLVGGLTGAALNAIAMVRECIFLQRDRRPWASAPWWPLLFGALSWISPVLEWIHRGGITLLPVVPTVGSMLFVAALYQRSPLRTKLLSLGGTLLWLGYSGAIGNVSGMASSGVSLVSTLAGLVRECRLRRKCA